MNPGALGGPWHTEISSDNSLYIGPEGLQRLPNWLGDMNTLNGNLDRKFL